MSVTYQDIEPLLDQGLTPAEIADTLRPLGVTVKQIPLEELRWWLRDQKLLFRGVDVPYVGPLAEASKNENFPQELRVGVLDLITHVFGTDKYLDTTNPVIAQRGLGMFAGLVQAQVVSPEQRDGFYSLGGGFKYAGVTESDISRVILGHTLEAAILAAQSSFARNESASQIVSEFEAAMTGVV